MAASLRQRGGTVTMRLAPDALGQVRVALTLHGGRVDATFEATTDQARKLLEGNMTVLRAALEAHGLTVDRLGVQATEGHAHHDPGTGQLSPDSGGGRAGGGGGHAASEHAGQHEGAGGTDARGLTLGDDPAEPTRHGPLFTGGAHGIRLRLDAVA
ncbi:MAG: flagellar hook-length control protein FliK [Phycisphaerales bacterium]|nr:flagellar hook-length control protein FliK [Phycisphaerales bacterium]